eukprot:Hpha_TRINITY_DN138_c0_g2::TRINITY_DN138_c0_g2_i1::g.82227::m.82227
MSSGFAQWLGDEAKRRLDAAGLPSNFKDEGHDASDGSDSSGAEEGGQASPERREPSPPPPPSAPSASPSSTVSEGRVSPSREPASEEEQKKTGLGRWIENRLQDAGLPAWEAERQQREEGGIPTPAPAPAGDHHRRSHPGETPPWSVSVSPATFIT